MTSTLDGEKNLKPKFAFQSMTQPLFKGGGSACKATIVCGPPNEHLYQLDGTIKVGEKIQALSPKQLMLRGAELKNTKWADAAVAYTGKDTKIVLNSGAPRFKQSNIERMTNYMLLYLIGLEILECIIIFIGAIVWNSRYAETYAEFIPKRYNYVLESFLSLFTSFVLLNIMVPISLIISVDMVKVAQAYFINKDEDMKDVALNRYSQAFSSSLNEELGQIEYIFSDKTGTLTSNTLEFKYCVVSDDFYGVDDLLKPTSIDVSMNMEEEVIYRKPTKM